ncbi:MAG: hypothetical protein HC882_07590 [Acidobacteria bacterium]|nr:hypothetical protein [Acidobacteriota bacterium]
MSVGAILVALAWGGVALAQETEPSDTGDTVLQAQGPSTRVLVVAKIEETDARRVLERVACEQLARKGVLAMAGSDVLLPEDLATEDALRAKATALGIDGFLGFQVLSIDEEVKPTPSVGVGIGVPVRIGPFRVFAGTSVPLGGGVKAVRKVSVRARFYNRPDEPAWEEVFTETLRDDNTRIAEKIAKSAVRSILRADLAGKP